MRKYMLKKALAVLLALLLTVGLAPRIAPPAAATGGPTGYWYDHVTEVIPVGDVYSVSTPEQLAWIARDTQHTEGHSANQFIGKTIRLTANIDLAAHYWVPFSLNTDYPFGGTFDGAGYTISNLLYVSPVEAADKKYDFDLIGFFGSAAEAVIKDVLLDDVDIRSTMTFSTIGGLVAFGNATDEGTVTLSGCSVSGYISGNGEAGGLVGRSSDCTVNNCFTNVTITGGAEEAGGLAGDMRDSKYTNCFAVGSVTAKTDASEDNLAGGLFGTADGGYVLNSYARCSVTGYIAGGLAGCAEDTEFANDYASCTVTAGTAAGAKKGGVFGTCDNAYADYVYWNSDLCSDAYGELVMPGDSFDLTPVSADAICSAAFINTLNINTKTLQTLVDKEEYDASTFERWKTVAGTNGGMPVLNGVNNVITRIVTFKGTGADTASAEYPAGTQFSIPGNYGYVIPYYAFSGWTGNAAGTGSVYTAGSNYTVQNDVTFYAKLTRTATVSVAYDGNGSDSGTAPAGGTYDICETVTLYGNTGGLTKSGYIFSGWTDNAAGTGAVYPEGSQYALGARDVKFYAKWTQPASGNWADAGNYAAVTPDGNVYTVSSSAQLAWVAHTVNSGLSTFAGKNIRLSENIDLSGHFWAPIGCSLTDASKQFAGTFDGDGHTVTGLTIGSAETPEDTLFLTGLFGCAAGTGETDKTAITDLGITGAVIYSSATALSSHGILAGCVQFAAVTNCSAEGLISTGQGSHAGGFIGTILISEITNCRSDAYVKIGSNAFAGGFINYLSPDERTDDEAAKVGSKIKNCSAAGSVCGGEGSVVAGFIGTAYYNHEIVNCYTAACLSGNSAGFAVGFLVQSQNSILKNCYAAGSIEPGGFSFVYGFAAFITGTLQNVYWNSENADKAVFAGTDTSTDLPALDMRGGTFVDTLNANAAALSDPQLKTWTHVWFDNHGFPVFSGIGNTTTYTVTYDGNGSTGGTAPEDEISWYAGNFPAIVLGAGTMTKSGCTFMGWADNAAGTGTVYAAGDRYVLNNANATLYAVWQSNSSGGGYTGSKLDFLIGGEKTAITVTESMADNGKTRIITVNNTALKNILSAKDDGADVTLPIGNCDTAVAVLSAETLRYMSAHGFTLTIQTEQADYTLPADALDFTALTAQFGTNVSLSDIKVQITVAKSSAQTVQLAENAAEKGGYTLVVPPIDCSVTFTYGDRTIEVKDFSAYVERTIPIPDGVDPSKITTGVIIGDDGTARHVPTQITLINGKYYAKINSLTNSTYALVCHPIVFTDMENHWAKEVVNDLGSRMVLTGDGSGGFNPDGLVTRAEFAAIVVRALGLLQPGTGTDVFSDVKKGAWYYDAVSIACRNGILAGYEDGRFGPEDPLTREQAMTIVARAMKITGLDRTMTDSEAADLLARYADSASVSDWAKNSVAVCIGKGLVNGRDGLVAPDGSITRAEVAAVVTRLLKQSNLI